MKELSTEEKAKRYDKVIERATKHRNNDGLTLEQYETIDIILPELKESEDEKIRKAIYNCIKLFGFDSCFFKDVSQEECLSWLEKQGERKEATCVAEIIDRLSEKEQEILFKELDIQKEHNKFIESIRIGDQVTRNQDGMLVNLSQLKMVAKPFEKQVEQKSTNIDLDELIIQLEETIGTSPHSRETIKEFFQEAIQKYLNALQEANKKIGELIDENYYLKEQKPAWSEEDEMFVHGLIRGLSAKRDIHKHTTFSSDCIDITETINWLKELRDRVQPQPKQEWSMYDETILKALIDHFEYKKEFNEAEDYDIVLWLKSLRPQNRWKPSDEQLECLGYAIEKAEKDWSPLTNNRVYLTLKALEEQLKKLREE